MAAFREGPAPPVPLRPEELPSDLVCSICLGVPPDPAVPGPCCEHVFCHGCLLQAVDRRPACPLCRQPCYEVQRLRQGSLAYRLWSSVEVKCGHHDKGCCWSGSIVDVNKHDCRFRSRRKGADPAELKRLKEEKEELKRDLSASMHALNEREEENERLQRELSTVKEKLAKYAAFDGSYNYKRHNVVQLSQLISRYLENKPSSIDSNKIFGCVQSCYIDLQQGWQDNPDHYHMDMRMLLATCAASTWFTDRQQSNISNWLLEQGWK